MKAILLKKCGMPSDLEIGEAAKPFPNDGEVLVKVHAASINDWDWGLVRGSE
jgi:NADPH:quinone reductase-like Zn-dependent oxidoreductase